MTVLRSIAAHYAQIWHRAYIQYAPPVLKRLQTDTDKSVYQRTPWAWIVIVADLVDTIRDDHSYSASLSRLIQAHPDYVDGLKYPKAA